MKRIYLTGFFLFFLVVAYFCILNQYHAESEDSIQVKHPEESKKASILDNALSITGQNRESINLNQYRQDHVLTAGRLPVIDDVLANPFYAPALVQAYASRMNGSKGSITPGSVFSEALDLIGADKEKWPKIDSQQRSLLDIFDDIQRHFNKSPLSSGTRKYYDTVIRGLPEGLEDAMVIICDALYQTAVLRQDAIKKLTTAERHWFVENPLGYIFSSNEGSRLRLFNRSPSTQLKYLDVVRKVDLTKLMSGMLLMTDAIESTRPRLDAIHNSLWAKENGDLLLEFNSAIGPIIVGGPGINRYDSDAALIVELDGSDIYLNNAGGSLPMRGVACVVDMSGNDIYRNTRTGCLGSGVLGVGLLIDYRGSDSYTGGDCSIGCGFAGAGIVYDENDNDHYQSGVLTQGAGIFGVGLAIDVDEHDVYECDSLGQGFGSTMGIGILINMWGRDNYVAGKPLSDANSRTAGISQGSAIGFWASDQNSELSVYGGIGLLIDSHGNDTYFSNMFSQGSGFALSLGCLVDNEGHDLYDTSLYSQGFGQNYATGILIDHSGSDRYNGSDTVQGAAICSSSGILLDYSGNDTYRLKKHRGLGHARVNEAFALFIDYAGDDRFECGDYACGDVLPPIGLSRWPIGLFINHFGNDTYYSNSQISSEYRNDTTWHSSNGAVGIDTSIAPILYFVNQQGNSNLYYYDMSPVNLLEQNADLKVSRLGSSDVFTRFNSISTLISQGTDALPKLCKSVDLGHPEYRRTIEEAIELILHKSGPVPNTSEVLSPLFNSIDWETRRFGIEIAGFLKWSEAGSEIRELLADEEPKVRNSAAWALAIILDQSSIPVLKKMAVYDSNASCRSSAIKALAKFSIDGNSSLFKECLRDPDKSVQFAAIQALKNSDYREAVGTLQILTTSDSFQIRRAAGQTLLSMSEKSGFPILINTMKYRSLDNSEEYVPNSLISVLQRYSNKKDASDDKEWQKWWAEYESTTNLKTMLPQAKQCDALMEKQKVLSLEEFYNEYTTFHIQFPDYRGCDIEIARILYNKCSAAIDEKPESSTLIMQALNAALGLDPVPEYRGLLAEIFLLENEPESAMKQLERGLEGDPLNAYLLSLLSIIPKEK